MSSKPACRRRIEEDVFYCIDHQLNCGERERDVYAYRRGVLGLLILGLLTLSLKGLVQQVQE
jgi:hypothetical protein